MNLSSEIIYIIGFVIIIVLSANYINYTLMKKYVDTKIGKSVSRTKPTNHVKSKIESNINSNSNIKPKLEPKPEPKLEAKPEPKPEPKLEAKPEPKIEAKLESKLEPNIISEISDLTDMSEDSYINPIKS